MSHAVVFRAGVPEPPAQRGVEEAAYLLADAYKPPARQGRMNAIFAAPTLAAVGRWASVATVCRVTDVKVRQLIVEASTVFVYDVILWEQTAATMNPEVAVEYWASGQRLDAWLAQNLDGEDWEVLLGINDILGVRPVSMKRVLAAQTDHYYAERTKQLSRRWW
jgi:hypothetical protein